MPTIRRSADCCTVIVTVDADPELMSELEDHARDGLEQFAQLKGFISGATHVSNDRARLVQYLQWETEADHLACVTDRRWDDVPSTRRFMDLMASGRTKVDVRTYSVRAAWD